MEKLILSILGISFTFAAYSQEMTTPYKIKVSEHYINCKSYYAAPAIVDYDNDGLDDLIVGTFKGKFRFYKNVGTKSQPKYNDFVFIQANGKDAQVKNW